MGFLTPVGARGGEGVTGGGVKDWQDLSQSARECHPTRAPPPQEAKVVLALHGLFSYASGRVRGVPRGSGRCWGQ